MNRMISVSNKVCKYSVYGINSHFVDSPKKTMRIIALI